MPNDTPLPIESLLLPLARPGRPVFLRHGRWPRGRWIAVDHRAGRVAYSRLTSPAPEHWRMGDESPAGTASSSPTPRAAASEEAA